MIPRALPLSPGRAFQFALSGLLAIVLVVSIATTHVAAHAQLVNSAPPADALLAVPPSRIDLSMSERVATVDGSPAISVLDENGRKIATGPTTVDASSQTHISAPVSGVGVGVFTVVWTATSADDGHTLTGTFAFRVGGTDRAPGAATTEGEFPRPWAVATRWITFLGAGSAAASLLFVAIGLFGSNPRTRGWRRRLRLAAGSAAAGLIATLLEPVLQSKFPAQGVRRGSIEDAVSALPSAWWTRAPALAGALLIALALMRIRVRPRGVRALGTLGAAAALISILGLALTTHTAARESWRLAAVASIVVHEWAGALWIGGLICLAVSIPGRADDSWDDGAIRTFSMYALATVAILGLAGLVNAGLIFPSVRSVWTSDFGRVLIGKSIILLPALALAGRHRRSIRRAVGVVGATLRSSIRLETGLVAAVVLGGTILALVAPPLERAAGGTSKAVDLAAELSTSKNQYVRFTIAPVRTGENTVTAFVTNGVPVAYDPGVGAMVDQAPMDEVALLRLTLTSLDHDAPPTEIDLTAMGKGVFSGKVQLNLTDWWRVDFTVRRLGVEDETATTYIMTPDPNVNGFSAPKTPTSDPSAVSLFQRGLANLVSLHSVHYTEQLGGGGGTFVVSDQRYRDASFGGPAAMEIDSANFTTIRRNGEQWSKTSSGSWQHSDSGQLSSFSTWGDDFAGAVGFQLGAETTINGEDAQVISFFVPGTSLAPAWYSWWISKETGQIRRLTMISRGHYMIRDYLEYNTPLAIEPPADNATPPAVASPSP